MADTNDTPLNIPAEAAKTPWGTCPTMTNASINRLLDRYEAGKVHPWILVKKLMLDHYYQTGGEWVYLSALQPFFDKVLEAINDPSKIPECRAMVPEYLDALILQKDFKDYIRKYKIKLTKAGNTATRNALIRKAAQPLNGNNSHKARHILKHWNEKIGAQYKPPSIERIRKIIAGK